MDELEKLLAFVDVEISLAEDLEQITEIKVQQLKDLNKWADTVLRDCTMRYSLHENNDTRNMSLRVHPSYAVSRNTQKAT